MAQDEIIAEVRALREAYGSRFGFDIRALYSEAKEREGKSERLAVALQPRRTAAAIESPAPAEDHGRGRRKTSRPAR